MAEVAWPAADLQDMTRQDNPMSLAQLQAYAPGLDWGASALAYS